MCLDNICWISSSAEWETEAIVSRKKLSWKGHVKKYSIKEKLDYVYNYRIISVLTDIRDIIPAVLTSGLMSLLISLIN